MFSVSRDPVTDDAHTYAWFSVSRGGFDALERHICNAHWSGILWQPGVRKKENFFACALAVLDFDHGPTKAEILQEMAPYRYLIGSTQNDGREKASKTPGSPSRPACDRFRLVVPFSEPIFSRDVYEYNMKLLIRKYRADPQGSGAHMKWKPCREIFARKDHGETLQVSKNIPEEETEAFKIKKRKEEISRYKKDGKIFAIPKRVLSCLQGNVMPGGRNRELFVTCATLFELGMTYAEVRKLVEKIPWFHECSGEDALASAARKSGEAQ